MKTISLYVLAAVLEIGGAYAFWAWLRLDKPAGWSLAGIAALILFAIVLTQSEALHAGRAYAAYGGIYIVSSLAWLWAVEAIRPDRWDLAGASLCILGAVLILAGPR